MKNLLILLCAVAALNTTALAQSSLRVIDSIQLKTASPQDPQLYRVFSFSEECTDDFDPDHEVLVPAFPPSFFAAFTSGDLGLPRIYEDYMQNDCRGIPDSVAGGMATIFSIRYELQFQGNGGKVTIVFPQRLARGLDSINIQDVEGFGNVFNYTYVPGDESQREFTIDNTELRFFYLTAYYNARTLSVRQPAGTIAEEMEILPNPAQGGSVVRLRGDVPAGSRLFVSDMLGRMVENRYITEGTRSLDLDSDALPAGLYIARLLDVEGKTLYKGRLAVVR